MIRQVLEYILPNVGPARFLWSRRLLKEPYVSPKAELLNPANIQLGKRVLIDSEARLDASVGRITIADDCQIKKGALLDCCTWDGKIEIGQETNIGPYSVIYGQGGVKIGRYSMTGPGAKILAFNHEIPWRRQPTKNGITIGDRVWIGANAMVLDGVSIGDCSVIGANSVVTRSIPECSVAVGTPARIT